MAKQLGRKLILEISDEANDPTFTIIGGSQNVRISDTGTSIDATTADISDLDAPPRHDALLGKRMISFSGTFTLEDTTVEASLDTIIKSDTRTNVIRATVPDFKTYTGKALFTEISYEGSLEGIVQYTISAEFVGAVTEAAPA